MGIVWVRLTRRGFHVPENLKKKPRLWERLDPWCAWKKGPRSRRAQVGRPVFCFWGKMLETSSWENMVYHSFSQLWLLLRVEINSNVLFQVVWILPWKFNISPLKIAKAPKGKADRLPTIIFQGRAVKLQGCMSLDVFIWNLVVKIGSFFEATVEIVETSILNLLVGWLEQSKNIRPNGG